LPTLRNKKQCLHNIAHESAHASPWVIIDSEYYQEFLPDLYFTGHFKSQREKLWEFKRKLKIKYPLYYKE
jgi:hypothetical protein